MCVWCSVNSYPVAAEETLVTRVQLDINYGPLAFMACDARSCSRVDVYGATPRGELNFRANEGCNRLGTAGCRALRRVSPAPASMADHRGAKTGRNNRMLKHLSHAMHWQAFKEAKITTNIFIDLSLTFV